MLAYMKRGQPRNRPHHVVSIRTTPAGWLTVRGRRRLYVIPKFKTAIRFLPRGGTDTAGAPRSDSGGSS